MMDGSQATKDNHATTVLVAFAKNPYLAAVKTRLAMSIGQKAADEIYVAMLDDCLNQLCQISGTAVYLACYPDISHSFFQSLAGKYRISLLTQRGDNLGERMLNCVSDLLLAHQRVIIFGTDVPLMPIASLSEALASPCKWDILVGPGADGGYWAFGAQHLGPGILENIEWSTADVMKKTIENCQRLGLKVTLLDTAIDVDNIESLRELMIELPSHVDAGKNTRQTLVNLGLLKLKNEGKFVNSIESL